MRHLEFASLQVKDLEASKKFYTEKLGFELSDMKNPEAVIFKYNKGESSFALRTPLEDLRGKELGNGVSIWFTIDEKIEDIVDRFVENNISILGAVMQTPFGKAVHVKDLDGYKLTFLEPSEKI